MKTSRKGSEKHATPLRRYSVIKTKEGHMRTSDGFLCHIVDAEYNGKVRTRVVPLKLPYEDALLIQKMYEDGVECGEIAAAVGRSRANISHIAMRLGCKRRMTLHNHRLSKRSGFVKKRFSSANDLLSNKNLLRKVLSDRKKGVSIADIVKRHRVRVGDIFLATRQRPWKSFRTLTSRVSELRALYNSGVGFFEALREMGLPDQWQDAAGWCYRNAEKMQKMMDEEGYAS